MVVIMFYCNKLTLLVVYLGWKGFAKVKPSSQSTIDGIRAVFKLMWDEASV